MARFREDAGPTGLKILLWLGNLQICRTAGAGLRCHAGWEFAGVLRGVRCGWSEARGRVRQLFRCTRSIGKCPAQANHCTGNRRQKTKQVTKGSAIPRQSKAARRNLEWLDSPFQGNGAYIRPKTFLPRRLRRGGCGRVSNRTSRLKRCISLRVAWTSRHCRIAVRNHSYCSLESATLTVLPLTLRVH